VPESGAPELSVLITLELPLFIIHTEPVASAAVELGAFTPPYFGDSNRPIVKRRIDVQGRLEDWGTGA
jgi:hypothetical protein